MVEQLGPEKYDYPKLTPEQDAAQRGGDPPSTRKDDTKPARPTTDDPSVKERQDRARQWLEGQAKDRGKGRKNELWPYLLVRAMPGDSGGRPLPGGQPFWESPDILVVPGTPATYDGVSATLNPVPGQQHTVFVRVWNLGHLGAIGVKVRVWWANPSFSFDDPLHPPNFIGATYVDLPDRRSPGCVQLVRIPTPWVPVVENGGHECMLSKVECFADGTGPGYDAAMNRHVGQRNLMLAAGNANIEPLLVTLGQRLAAGTHVELRHSVADLQTMLLVHQPELLGRITTPAFANDALASPVGIAQPGFAVPVGIAQPGFAAPVGLAQPAPDPDIPVANFAPVMERRLGAVAALNTGAARIIPGIALADAARRSGGRVDPGAFAHAGVPGTAPVAGDTPPLVRMLGHLGFQDLAGAAIAQQLGGGTSAGHLLRFEATRDGQVVGGYTIVVTDNAG